MTHRNQFLFVFFLALIPCGPSSSFGQPFNSQPLTLDIRMERAGLFWANLNDDSLTDLLVADDSKFYIYYQQSDGGFSDKNMQEIADEKEGAIFDVADLRHDGESELITLNQSGVYVYDFDKQAKKLVRSAKPLLEGLRGVMVQHLVPADFIFDVDRDGLEDIIFPLDGKYYLYFQQKDGTFSKKNQVTTKPIKVSMSMRNKKLRDEIETTIKIPRLAFVDLNGDGRLDLRASNDNRESFYLQAADGGIPENPTYEVDLKHFKDQVPKSESKVKIDQFQFIPADLDGDGREDYVIVAGPKIWVFKATEKGVDFNKPDQIIKVSAETMTVVLLPINDDNRPDLVIVKYQVPSLGRLVAGLAIGLRFEVDFLGYNNVKETVFSRKPDYRSTMVFKTPPILKLLGEFDTLAERARQIERNSKSISGGDFNADGKRDVLKLDGNALKFFVTPPNSAEVKTDFEAEQGDSAFYRRVLFGEKTRDVSIDTLMNFFSDTVNAFSDEAIAGRQPSFQIPLSEDIAKRARQILCRDLNGDGIADVIVFLAQPEGKEKEELETQTTEIWLSHAPAKP